MPSCRMGTLDAEKLMICGGSVPGGSCRNRNCDAAVTWALAVSSEAPGCRNTYTIASPLYVVDSICWILSTSVVSDFSYGDVKRPSSSSGLRPVYVQPIETTGILILGKMSVGVRRITTGAAMRINSARTINVYGRLRATLTIHMRSFCAPFCRGVGGHHRQCVTIGLAYAVLKHESCHSVCIFRITGYKAHSSLAFSVAVGGSTGSDE